MPRRVHIIITALFLAAGCARGGRAEMPARPRSTTAVRRTAEVERCLSRLEAGDSAGWRCLGEQLAAPSCRRAWRAASAPPTEESLARVASACARAYCPKLSAPRPALCRGAPRRGPAGLVAFAELGAVALAHDLPFVRQPDLIARTALALVTYPSLRLVSAPVQLASPKSPAKSPRPAPLIVTVSASAVTCDGRTIAEGALVKRFADAVARRPKIRLIVRPAAGVNYARVIEVLDAAKRAGIHDIALTAAAPDR